MPIFLAKQTSLHDGRAVMHHAHLASLIQVNAYSFLPTIEEGRRRRCSVGTLEGGALGGDWASWGAHYWRTKVKDGLTFWLKEERGEGEEGDEAERQARDEEGGGEGHPPLLREGRRVGAIW